MDNSFQNTQKKPPTRITDLFQELGDEAFLINSICVYTNNQIIVKNRIYELFDLLDNGGMRFCYLKLLHAYLKGFDVVIVGIDIVTGEVLFRTHRLDAGIIPCDWLLLDLESFEKEINENTIRFSFKRNSLK